MRIAREGLKFILPALFLGFVFLALGWWFPFGLFLVLSVALAFFFRDPERVPPDGDRRLVAPADGRVLAVAPKTFLPNYREFYEKRQFVSGRDASSREVLLLGQRVPFGNDLREATTFWSAAPEIEKSAVREQSNILAEPRH